MPSWLSLVLATTQRSYAMRDIVFHHIAHKEHGEEDAHNGIDQIEQVERRSVEAARQQGDNLVDEPVQQVGGNGREQANKESQEEHKHALTDMLGTP